MSTGLIVLIIVIVVVVVALAFVGLQYQRRRALRERFGPEYDRAVSETGNRSAAEKELRGREERHAQLELRPLTDEARDRYSTAWEQVQNRFIDAPDQAVGEADDLVTRLAAERGYPTGDFDEQISTLSVEYGHTLSHLRDAHEINLKNERGEATTEELRQALVHYRSLFADLLGADPVRPAAPGPAAATPAAATPAASVVDDPVAPVPTQRTEAEREEELADETAADPTATPDSAYEPGRAEPVTDEPVAEEPVAEDRDVVTDPEPAPDRSRG